MKELYEVVADLEAYCLAKESEINNGHRGNDLTALGLLKNRRKEIEFMKESIKEVDTDVTLKTLIITNYRNDSVKIKKAIDTV